MLLTLLGKIPPDKVKSSTAGSSAFRFAPKRLVSHHLLNCTNATIQDPDDSERVTDKTRKLGLVVVRGTQVSLVSPQEGVEEIANPFLVGEEEEE